MIFLCYTLVSLGNNAEDNKGGYMAILAPTKDEQIEAERVVVACYNMNKGMYDRARALQSALGLGGLWRGTDSTLAEIITALQNERKSA